MRIIACALAWGVLAVGGLAAGPAAAASVDDLVSSGFQVVSNTSVKGEFNGCDRGTQVTLANGVTFVCSGFGYMYAQNPKAVLLKSRDGRAYKLLIRGTAFDGALAAQ